MNPLFEERRIEAMPHSSRIVIYALVAAVVVLLLSGYVGIKAAQSSIAASVAIAGNKDILFNLERTPVCRAHRRERATRLSAHRKG